MSAYWGGYLVLSGRPVETHALRRATTSLSRVRSFPLILPALTTAFSRGGRVGLSRLSFHTKGLFCSVHRPAQALRTMVVVTSVTPCSEIMNS